MDSSNSDQSYGWMIQLDSDSISYSFILPDFNVTFSSSSSWYSAARLVTSRMRCSLISPASLHLDFDVTFTGVSTDYECCFENFF